MTFSLTVKQYTQHRTFLTKEFTSTNTIPPNKLSTLPPSRSLHVLRGHKPCWTIPHHKHHSLWGLKEAQNHMEVGSLLTSIITPRYRTAWSLSSNVLSYITNLSEFLGQFFRRFWCSTKFASEKLKIHSTRFIFTCIPANVCHVPQARTSILSKEWPVPQVKVNHKSSGVPSVDRHMVLSLSRADKSHFSGNPSSRVIGS